MRARRRLARRMALLFHPDYSAPRLRADSAIPHLQLQRAERALAHLASQRLLHRRDVRVPALASFWDLQRVHSAAYLERASDTAVLARIFGVEAQQLEPDLLLEAQRRAVGGTIEAALFAVADARRVAVNLGGGFHHAAPDAGAGFCIFNDVAVAIAVLRARGERRPLAIVDLDFHQGDGNLAAFSQDATVLVYSLHGSSWTELRSPLCFNDALPGGTSDCEYMNRLAGSLPARLAEIRPAVVFFLAGADVLAGDLLGDFALTPRGVLARDCAVIDWAHSLGASVVVTLAGGYSPRAWECTANLLRWLLTGLRQADEASEAALSRRYAEVARRIDPFELQREAAGLDVAIREEDVLQDLGRTPHRRLLLGYYSAHGVEFALERFGVLGALRDKGFSELRVQVIPDDPGRQILRVFGRRSGFAVLLLVELVVARRWLTLHSDLGGLRVEVLYVEWLLLQDPTAVFTRDRPQLPGQEFPGLGLANEVVELLVVVCRRLGLAAIEHRPAHYHNAVWASVRFRFADADLEGRLRAMRRALAKYPLGVASRIVEERRLRMADGSPLLWEPGEYLLPVSDELERYFHSREYTEKTRSVCEKLLSQGLAVWDGPAGPDSVAREGDAQKGRL